MALSESDIAHLLRRTEFISTDAKLAALINLPTREAAVDAILARNINATYSWPTGTPFNLALGENSDGSNSWEYNHKFRRWWIDSMAFGAAPLREKMTLFWHGHFVSSAESTSFHHHTMAQNQLYRDYAFGNFRELAQKMSLEPLMMYYLDNRTNTKRNVNENFGRELLELFILGLNNYGLLSGTGTYTQNDVVASARAWTGHTLATTTLQPTPFYKYDATKHWTDPVTFLGRTAAMNGTDIIDRVLTVDPYKEISARFIASKLWSYFAYPNPDTSIVTTLIATYKDTLNISELLRAIFVHPEFYSDKAKTGLVSTPAEFVTRLFALTGTRMTADISSWTVWTMPDLGQELLNPPNVSGWKQNNYWLSTSQIGARGNVAGWHFWGSYCQNIFLDLDTVAASTAVTTAARRMGLTSLQTPTRTKLESWLTGERARRGSWKQFRSAALFHMILMSPDFQLS